MDLAAVSALRSDAGMALTEQATTLLDAGLDLMAVAGTLRAAAGKVRAATAGPLGPELVGWALTQARLRRAARARFGDLADRLLWTPMGLEQATRPSVARHRAARFVRGDRHRVVDLCCGVGGDLLALAGAGLDVTGVDADAVTAAVAEHNLTVVGLADRARVQVGDAQLLLATLPGRFDAAFIDPSRRSISGRRTFDPAAYAPPFGFVSELVARVPSTAAKVAPGLPHHLLPAGVEAEWVSDHGDVKELALWFGPLAGVDGSAARRATLLPAGDTLTDDPGCAGAPVGPVGAWLHEPDGAVIRAGLIGETAAGLDGRLLDRTIAYLSTDLDVLSPFTTRYAVDEVLPFGLKRLKAALRARDAADVVVKKRGTAVDPGELRRRLRLDGSGPTVTVVLTRVAGRQVAVLTTPAGPAPAPGAPHDDPP